MKARNGPASNITKTSSCYQRTRPAPKGFNADGRPDSARLGAARAAAFLSLGKQVSEQDAKPDETQNGTARDFHALAKPRTKPGPQR